MDLSANAFNCYFVRSAGRSFEGCVITEDGAYSRCIGSVRFPTSTLSNKKHHPMGGVSYLVVPNQPRP